MRRESKCFVEKLFKKYDKIGAGAIPRTDMKTLVEKVVPAYMQLDNEELEEMLTKHAKSMLPEIVNFPILKTDYLTGNKHTVLNLKTKQMEIEYRKSQFTSFHFLQPLNEDEQTFRSQFASNGFYQTFHFNYSIIQQFVLSNFSLINKGIE